MELLIYNDNIRNNTGIAIVGYGIAKKTQFQQIVIYMLKLKEIAKPDYIADALVVSICHDNVNKLGKILKI